MCFLKGSKCSLRLSDPNRRARIVADFPPDFRAGALADVLNRNALADISVEDPPLEDIIAKVFEEARLAHDAA